MIVRSEGRLKWSLHLILTLPGDAQRANRGWMFLEFVTMLSVERSELAFKLNHHLQGPRWACHLVLHRPWLCRIFLQLHYPQRIWPLWISRCWTVQQILMRIQLRLWSLDWWICVSVECCSIHRVCQVWIWWVMFDSMSSPLHMMGAKVNVRWLISAEAVWNFGSHLMSSRIQLLVSLIRKALSKPCRRNAMGWQPWRLVSSLVSRRKKSSASFMGWSLLPAVGLRMRSQNLMKAFVPGLWWRTLQEVVRQRARLQYPAQRPAWSRCGWFWEHLVASGEQNLPFMPSMWVKLSWTHHFVTKNESFLGCHLASQQHQESRFSWKHTRHLTVCVWRVLLGACFWKTLYPRLAWLAARQSRVFMVGWLTVPLPCFCAMWMTCWLPVQLTRHFIECSKSFPSMWRSVRLEGLLWERMEEDPWSSWVEWFLGVQVLHLWWCRLIHRTWMQLVKSLESRFQRGWLVHLTSNQIWRLRVRSHRLGQKPIRGIDECLVELRGWHRPAWTFCTIPHCWHRHRQSCGATFSNWG